MQCRVTPALAPNANMKAGLKQGELDRNTRTWPLQRPVAAASACVSRPFSLVSTALYLHSWPARYLTFPLKRIILGPGYIDRYIESAQIDAHLPTPQRSGFPTWLQTCRHKRLGGALLLSWGELSQ